MEKGKGKGKGKRKEKNILNFSTWNRYKINERIKAGYEKYMEKKENNNISNKTNGQ